VRLDRLFLCSCTKPAGTRRCEVEGIAATLERVVTARRELRKGEFMVGDTAAITSGLMYETREAVSQSFLSCRRHYPSDALSTGGGVTISADKC